MRCSRQNFLGCRPHNAVRRQVWPMGYWPRGFGGRVVTAISRYTKRPLPEPVQAKAAGPAVMMQERPKPYLPLIIQPDARDRWVSAQVSMFTPDRIESTIRGAMSGN